MRKGRNMPAMIVAILGGTLVSMLVGLLLASYAVAGVTPSYLPTPAIRETRVTQASQVGLDQMTTVQQIAARVSIARPDGPEL